MPLKARLPNLDGLAEAIKALYREVDGSYILDVDPADGWALEDINGLKSTLSKQKTEIQGLKTKLTAFGELDPQIAIDAVAKLKEYGNLPPEELAKAKVKAALDQQQQQHNVALQAKDVEMKNLVNQLNAVMIDQAGTAAIAAKGGNVKLLLPHVKSNLKLERSADGKFSVKVVDGEGNGRIHVANGQTSDMTIEQFVDEMAASQDFATAFKAVGRPGGGSNTNHQNRTNGSQPRVVDATDRAAVSSNLEAIAKGETTLSNF